VKWNPKSVNSRLRTRPWLRASVKLSG
jgi:hypothetical protein